MKNEKTRRTIVIGDIHGCCRELHALITKLMAEGKYNPEEDRLVFVGDYIDRGENPRLAVRYIRELQKKYGENVIALKGNHEAMLLDYLANADHAWLYNGYRKTLLSYENHKKEFLDDILWMASLPLYYEDNGFVCVHAGVDKSLPLEQQDAFTLLWTRQEFYHDSRSFGKKVIFGHTPTKFMGRGCTPQWLNRGNDIAIDTGCVYDGKLTALVIDPELNMEYCQVSCERLAEERAG